MAKVHQKSSCFDALLERSKLPVPKFFIVSHQPRMAARAHALLKESALYRATGQSERDLEMGLSDLRPPAAKFKFTKRSRVERVGGETVASAMEPISASPCSGHSAGLRRSPG